MSEIMTPKEVAKYLKMSVLTVYKHAKQGTIPGFRVGNSWRFDKKRIDFQHWAITVLRAWLLPLDKRS